MALEGVGVREGMVVVPLVRGRCVTVLCIFGLSVFAPGIYAQTEAQVRRPLFAQLSSLFAPAGCQQAGH